MADRKISELVEASSVASGDVMVVVTGVGVAGATLTTNKFPLSGLVNHIVNINELITAKTGIHIVPTISATLPNKVELNVSGYAYTVHTHTASQITDFSSAVSGEVQQIIKFQSSDLPCTGKLLVKSSDLTIPLSANSKYLCQLGTILTNNEDISLSGFVEITGTQRVNNPTQIYGTWSHLEVDNQGHGFLHNDSSAVTGYGLLLDGMDASAFSNPFTVINNFVVETTNNEADTVTIGIATNSTDQATSGVLKKGSWLKAEKII
jgi:hypothetical protein